MNAPRPYAMAMLEQGVPLSLLLDLALGVDSQELCEQERAAPPVEV